MNIIQQLKDNRYPFGMWPDPECYGKELGEAMQEWARKIGSGRFDVWGSSGQWCKVPHERHMSTELTFRLRDTYEEEPEIVEVALASDCDRCVETFEYQGGQFEFVIVPSAGTNATNVPVPFAILFRRSK